MDGRDPAQAQEINQEICALQYHFDYELASRDAGWLAALQRITIANREKMVPNPNHPNRPQSWSQCDKGAVPKDEETEFWQVAQIVLDAEDFDLDILCPPKTRANASQCIAAFEAYMKALQSLYPQYLTREPRTRGEISRHTKKLFQLLRSIWEQ